MGKDVVINILPSDDAFGLFSFTENSLSKVVDEQSGGTPVFLTITRGSKGSFGNVSIYWEAEESAEDITPSSGWVDFSQGQLAADLNIMVNNDVVRRSTGQHVQAGQFSVIMGRPPLLGNTFRTCLMYYELVSKSSIIRHVYVN